MPALQVDLAIPLINALESNPTILANLPAYLGDKTIFTSRPVPPDAPYPLIVISPDVAKDTSREGYSDQRPVVTRDVAVYGQNDSNVHYRQVETMAFAIYDQFHRNRMALNLPDSWVLVDILAHGPVPAPTDDEVFVGRVVSLDIFIASNEQ